MKHLYDSNFRNTENVARANSPVQASANAAAPVGAAEKEKVVFTSCSGCFQQIRNAIKSLRTKLLPQIYSLGFLNPDVEYFS